MCRCCPPFPFWRWHHLPLAPLIPRVFCLASEHCAPGFCLCESLLFRPRHRCPDAGTQFQAIGNNYLETFLVVFFAVSQLSFALLVVSSFCTWTNSEAIIWLLFLHPRLLWQLMSVLVCSCNKASRYFWVDTTPNSYCRHRYFAWVQNWVKHI